MDKATAPARTVCHGCRALSHELIGDDGEQRSRPVLLPGDGSLMSEIMPGMMVTAPCPICGDNEEAGWVDGFVPPV